MLEYYEKLLHLISQMWDEFHNWRLTLSFEMIPLGYVIYTLEADIETIILVGDTPCKMANKGEVELESQEEGIKIDIDGMLGLCNRDKLIKFQD